VAAGILSIGRLATDYRPHHAGVNTQNTRAQTTLAVWRVLQQYYLPFPLRQFQVNFHDFLVNQGPDRSFQPISTNECQPQPTTPFFTG
jgi:hypothetical protein